ncbi:uncharacterized protein LOC129765314 isoform X2 [Toxorhynchites rutilus septentrionalis]|nr:uncharacterized protein LOC129765314 isoform X2 [Toxorhynchites rutilus septentrionalis]
MAAVFASRQLDDLEIGETKLRNAMLTILQQNFQALEQLKNGDVGKFYNSVTLLGEYYNRKKFANGKRILILGQSLLLLLTTELEKEIKRCEETAGYTIDSEFAKLILSQVTLNGEEAKTDHKQEIEDLNYSIRKCLINVGGMSSRTKAYFLMTLDLFHMNFNLDTKLLEKLYGKYLFGPDDNTAKDAKESEVKHKCDKRAESVTADKPVASSDASASGSKTGSKKNFDKTDNARKQPVKSAPPKVEKKKAVPPARKTEERIVIPSTSAIKSPQNPPSVKKSPQNITRKNPVSPKKGGLRSKPPVVPKTSPLRATHPENSGLITPERSPLKTQSSNPNSSNTPEKSSVLKQNYKSPAKSSTSPASSTISAPTNISLKIPPTAVATHEDNVENLAWDDLTLQDESPQKINPHTKSFLSFLAQK